MHVAVIYQKHWSLFSAVSLGRYPLKLLAKISVLLIWVLLYFLPEKKYSIILYTCVDFKSYNMIENNDIVIYANGSET